jgi:hypothetical protein
MPMPSQNVGSVPMRGRIALSRWNTSVFVVIRPYRHAIVDLPVWLSLVQTEGVAWAINIGIGARGTAVRKSGAISVYVVSVSVGCIWNASRVWR